MSKIIKQIRKDYFNNPNCPDDYQEIKSKLEFKDQKPKHTKKMALIFSMVILLTLIITSSVLLYSNGKSIPTYLGMSVTPVNASSPKKQRRNIPFKNNSLIEDILTTNLNTNEYQYYAKKNEIILVNIKLNNTKNYEILSFTLNGVFYQAYQFEKGSDSENIIVEFECQSTSGIEMITIDSIKYINGSKITSEKVNYEGSKSISIGITYDTVPSLKTSITTNELNNFTYRFEIEDNENLLTNENITLYLFKEDKIIKQVKAINKELIGSWTDLLPNTKYQYALIITYDALDGKGNRNVLLTKSDFTTPNVLDINITSSDVNQVILSINKETDLIINSISLFKEDEMIKEIDPKSVENINLLKLDSLLSNNEYILKVNYNYHGNNYNQEFLVKTKAYDKPTPVIVINNIDYHFINVQIQNDINNELIVSQALGIYLNDTLVEEFSSIKDAPIVIDELFTNTTYTLKLTYQLDMQDGKEEVTEVISKDVLTLSYEKPSVTIKTLFAVGSKITCSFDINDPNKLITDYEYILTKDGVTINTQAAIIEINPETTNGTFKIDYQGMGEYKLIITYYYDLLDGKNTQNNQVQMLYIE